jgi:lysophospholipase L1-like esterase
LRPLFFAVITLLAATALALLGAELGLRAFWLPMSLRSTPESEGHPVYLWAPRPGAEGLRVTPEYTHAWAHTSQGLRGSQVFAADRPANVRARVLFLGDSFTYGLGSANDETFVARIAAAWPDVEVANAGCNGYGQRQELAILDTLGAALKPNLTVVMFFWNDLEDNFKRAAPAFHQDASGRVVRTDLAVPRDFDPLARRQALPGESPAASEPLWKIYYLRQLIDEAKAGLKGGLLGGARLKIRTVEQRAAAWAATAELLELLKQRAADWHSQLVVVSIPDYNQVDPQAVYRNIDPFSFDIEADLAAVTRRLGIDYIDLLPAMRSRFRANQPPWYYAQDRHLTPAGNAVLAEVLQPRLAPLPALKNWTP